MASEQRWVTIVVRAWVDAADGGDAGVRVRLLRTGHDAGIDDRHGERVTGSIDEAVAIVAGWLRALASDPGDAERTGAAAAGDVPETPRRRHGDAHAHDASDATEDIPRDGASDGSDDVA